jgi:hypothetical protein
MSGRCSICHHPQHEEINAAFARDGIRSTARQFQVSSSALDRHKKHVRGKVASTPDALVERMLGLLRTATKDTPALRELRACLEQIGKMVKTTPERREEDLELAIATKIGEATLGFDPEEIARLKALVETANPLARIM